MSEFPSGMSSCMWTFKLARSLNDNIMTTGPEFFIALSILLVGMHEAVGRAYQDRSGYDLSNGPVTYEAYYPEDGPADGHPLMEKSYQTSYDNYPPADSLNRNKLFSPDNITPSRHLPPAYVNQYRRDQPHTELEDALKMLIDAIRDERVAPRPAIGQLYLKESSNLRKIDDDEYKRMGLENIFKPRPQVINYVFSKGSDVGGEADLVNADDGILQRNEERRDAERAEAPQVAAIEVSEKPHKIRHHHGDKLRRNRVSES